MYSQISLPVKIGQ